MSQSLKCWVSLLLLLWTSQLLPVEGKFLIHTEGMPKKKGHPMNPLRVALIFEIDSSKDIEEIPKVLSILHEFKVKGTFFFSKNTIYKANNAIKEIKTSGQRIGYKMQLQNESLKECQKACDEFGTRVILVPKEFDDFESYQSAIQQDYSVITCKHQEINKNWGHNKKIVVSIPFSQVESIPEQILNNRLLRLHFIFADLCDFFDADSQPFDYEKWRKYPKKHKN